MIPARIDFPCRTNTDYEEELIFTESADGSPVNLMGITFQMQVRDRPGGNLIFTPTLTVDGNALIVSWTRAQTPVPASYSHDIVAIYSNGFREPWCEGTVSVEQGVTING